MVEKTNWVDKERTYGLRGICMLMIIIHHINCYIGHPVAFIDAWGYMATGVFLFLSGFGLFMSISKKESLPPCWLKDKMIKIIKPFAFVYLLYLILLLIIDKDSFLIYMHNIPRDFISCTIPFTETWFLKIIIFLYILTYFVFRLNRNITYKVVTVFVVVLGCFLFARKFLPDYWSASVLNFPIGMMLGLYYNRLPTPSLAYLSMSIGALGIIWHFCYSITYLVSFASTFVALCFCTYVKINQTLLKYIGRESINFYLFQLIVLPFAKIFCPGRFCFSVTVITITFLLSIVYTLFVDNKPVQK